MEYSSPDSKAGCAPLVVSAICLFLNFIIGETILANLLLVLVSFFTAASAFFSSLIASFRASPANKPIGNVIASATIIGIIIWLIATDNIAMGYGP